MVSNVINIIRGEGYSGGTHLLVNKWYTLPCKSPNMFGFADRTARRDLKHMVEEGIIKKKGKSDKITHYELRV